MWQKCPYCISGTWMAEVTPILCKQIPADSLKVIAVHSVQCTHMFILVVLLYWLFWLS